MKNRLIVIWCRCRFRTIRRRIFRNCRNRYTSTTLLSLKYLLILILGRHALIDASLLLEEEYETIVLSNCLQIWRWRPIPNTDEYLVLPYQSIINNGSGLRHYDFNITQFVLTNKYNPFIPCNRNWRHPINFLLSDKTTCFQYRLKNTIFKSK